MTPYFSGALTERPPFFFTQSVTERPLLLESLSHIQVTSIFECPAPLGIRYEHTMTSHVSDSDVGLYYDFDVYTAKLLTILFICTFIIQGSSISASTAILGGPVTYNV